MAKRIVSAIMLCLILFSISAIAFSIQPAQACRVPIPVGENIEVFPDPRVGLVFHRVIVAGMATATETTRYPPPPTFPPEEGPMAAADIVPPPGFIGPVWDIRVTATYLGKVIIKIAYDANGPVPTYLWQTDIVPGDVNADGKVDSLDLYIIKNALGSTPGSPTWNPYCDLNGDNRICPGDLYLAHQHFGQASVWTDITTYVDTSNYAIYGETDHFSIFGIT